MRIAFPSRECTVEWGAGVVPTHANVSCTLNSASLLLIVLRNLLDGPDRDLPEELRIAAGEVVRQTERLVLDAMEETDTLDFKGAVGGEAEARLIGRRAHKRYVPKTNAGT
ncbi:hypothetical protein [Methylobacterium nonmethylotrophicum]|uniref:Uncharacterized protein n=1 Tax=Methylobacterium nonmethylotrophicum TaxID=1141884 RepID=A0A4Z0NEY1_9HYPH|nr:hypothetical protein [Methylobacterium nonmethylotrophicum]TGD93715.1 hypothetical protein EU555_33035 [Methylobacterium nonmethylotrophicum]